MVLDVFRIELEEEKLIFLMYLLEALKRLNLKTALQIYPSQTDFGHRVREIGRKLEGGRVSEQVFAELGGDIAEILETIWMGGNPIEVLKNAVELKKIAVQQKLSTKQAVFSAVTVIFTVAATILPVMQTFFSTFLPGQNLLLFLMPAVIVGGWWVIS